MQRSMDFLAAGCTNFSLIIDMDKTVAMHQPSLNTQHCTPPRITVDNHQLKTVDNFAYLGSTLFNSTRIDDEVAHRISKASQFFDRLQNSAWNHHGLQLNTKLKTFRVVVLTTLFDGAETWTVYSNHSKKLNHSHLSCLCRILKLRWQNRIPDTKVIGRTGIPSIHAMLRQLHLRWGGHLVRMEDIRLPKQLLYYDVAIGARRPGGPKRC
ncbi:hypothetical protein SprV_0301307500 [Sparganum proliferum]